MSDGYIILELVYCHLWAYFVAFCLNRCYERMTKVGGKKMGKAPVGAVC